MNSFLKKTVVLIAGLPYSGKTAIIQSLGKRLSGKVIYVDEIFRDLVLEEDVCLERWLEEGPRLVEQIIEIIRNSIEQRIYVEVGIMQTKHRETLINWIKDHNYRHILILLQCISKNMIYQRQQIRAEKLAKSFDKLKIAIGMEELYGPISAAFESPVDEEEVHTINTAEPIENNIEEICRLLLE
jgi:dephospho-CoA kinase